MLNYLVAINNAMGEPVRLPLLPQPSPKLPKRPRHETPLLAQRVTGHNPKKRGKLNWLPVGQLLSPDGQAISSTYNQQGLLRIYRSKRSVNL